MLRTADQTWRSEQPGALDRSFVHVLLSSTKRISEIHDASRLIVMAHQNFEKDEEDNSCLGIYVN